MATRKSGDTGYVFYQSYGSIKTQNKNIVEADESSQYPKNLYGKQPFGYSYCQPLQYECPSGPVDSSIDYMFGTEKQTHPPHFSHFAYPWCPNGYCVGNFPGRYNTPEAMRWQTGAQPVNCAPDRFYKGRFVDPNNCMSPAYTNSMIVRNAIPSDGEFI